MVYVIVTIPVFCLKMPVYKDFVLKWRDFPDATDVRHYSDNSLSLVSPQPRVRLPHLFFVALEVILEYAKRLFW